MNISIDLDGVLVDRPKYQIKMAKKYAKQNNLSSKIKNAEGYNVNHIFGWGKEQLEDFWDKYLWEYTKLPPIRGAKAALYKLKLQGDKILINTSRWLTDQENEVGQKMRQNVKDWFAKYQLPYDDLVFANFDKLSVVKKYKIDCHIEDSPRDAEPIAELMPVIMFNAPYNKNYNGKNIYHAKTWKNVLNIINKLK